MGISERKAFIPHLKSLSRNAQKLLETFDEIYILNLHGSSRIGERTPDDKKDENVFDIQQGVAIALFLKYGKKA